MGSPDSTELQLHWGNLHRMLAAFDDVGQQSGEIADYFTRWVCDPAPFGSDACALRPIGQALPGVADAFGAAQVLFGERWADVRAAVEHTAREIDALDGAVGHAFDALGPGLVGRVPPDVLGIEVDPFPLRPVNGHLGQPAEGRDQLRHDPAFEAAAGGFDVARDAINLGVDTLNAAVGAARGVADAVGVDLSFTIPRLPSQSLRDYLVYPLSADYRGIGRNADACSKVDEAMQAWGSNFALLSGSVHLALEGRTSLGLVAQLNAYGLVMRGVGAAIGQGNDAFRWVAAMSERIAVVVENAIVELGERLSRLVAKIASRFAPVVGWGALVLELARKGVDAVLDIIRDVQEIVALIEGCRALVDEVRAFAEVAAERIGVLGEVPSLVRALPGVMTGGGVGALRVDLGAVRAPLDDPPTISGHLPPEQSALETGLEALEAIG